MWSFINFNFRKLMTYLAFQLNFLYRMSGEYQRYSLISNTKGPMGKLTRECSQASVKRCLVHDREREREREGERETP